MEVTPAEGDLEHVVKVGEGAVGADQQSPPDQGLIRSYPDVEPVDFGRRFIAQIRFSVPDAGIEGQPRFVPLSHIDETSWRQGRRQALLWGA